MQIDRSKIVWDEPKEAPKIDTAKIVWDEPEKEVDYELSETIKNIPSSAKQFGSDLIQPFIHPVNTAKAVGNLGLGGIDKLTKGLVESLPDDFVKAGNKFNNYLVDLGLPLERLPEDPSKMTYQNEKYADQVAGFIGDRYGTVDNFKKTAMKDPVGLLADASMVLTGGGTAAARAPGLLGKTGRAIQTTGKAIEPINMVKGGAKYATSKLMPKNVPTSLYESSAKFSTTLPKAKREAMANTALEHRILPTARGVDQLNNIINGFDSKINTLIDDATQAGKKIPVGAVFQHLKEVRRNLGGVKIEGSSDIRRINRVAKDFNEHMQKKGKKYLTPRELQEFKTDTYKKINFDAKQLRSNIGKVEAQKAMARGAKEAIEKVADVKDFNRELGKLLELKEPLQKASGRIENRDLMGIGAPIKITAASAAAGPAGTVAGTVLAFLDNPQMKARLARKLKDIQDAGKMNLIDHELLPTLVQLGVLQAGRLEEESRPSLVVE